MPATPALAAPRRRRRTAVLSLALAAVAAGCATARPAAPPAATTAPTRAPAEPARPAARAAGDAFQVPVSSAFALAVARGTRAEDGRPGPRYWQQYARYRIEAALDPASRRLTGRQTVRYYNRSPQSLDSVALHLYQNLHAPDGAEGTRLTVTRGVELSRVAAQGQLLGRGAPGAGYRVEGTVAWLRLPRPVPSGDSLDLAFEWAFTVPTAAPRMGTDGSAYFIAYWYPQLAVFDDVSGWQTDPYTGGAEFYMGYGDYDVALTVPDGWLVGATGALANAAEVLSDSVRARLAAARRARGVVRVVTEAERGAGRATRTGRDGRLTWRFAATNVRDFAWAASRDYLWDVAAATVGDPDGDGRADTAPAHALYRPSAQAWAHAARFARHSLDFLSRYLWPYPYPQMTAAEGPNCGGMEYPMITCIADVPDTVALYSVIVHEIAHMWFPMQVGSDEKRHAWQDEGLTQFNEAQATREFFGGRVDSEGSSQRSYLTFGRAGRETELMRHGDRYPPGGADYAIASYEKPSAILRALRGVLGEEAFLRAYREYGRRWVGKHPQAYDFFNALEDVSGRDLSWFWRSWFFETWTLDQAVEEVRPVGDSVEIVVANRGRVPMPVRLALTRADGSLQRVEVPVDVWLAGARQHSLRVAAAPAVVRVEIDPEQAFPDVSRANQRWTRE